MLTKLFFSFKALKFFLKGSFLSLFGFFIHTQIPFFNTYDLIYNKENPKNDYVIGKLLPIDYISTIYLPTCLSQMLYNEKKSIPSVTYKREYLAMKDEGVVALDWVANEEAEPADKLLVIMHGLTGGSETSYIREIAHEFSKIKGFKIVVINYRGISGSPLLTPRIYHVGLYDDLHEVMKYIKNTYPDLKCYTLGTSMGANLFTKLFGNTSEFDNYIKGFISVSNPLDVYEVEKYNRNSVLDTFLVQRQRNYLNKHKHVLSDIVGKLVLLLMLDFEGLAKVKKYREFDQLITIKLFGFESADEYYQKCSSIQDLKNVNIPGIFFNAKNDLLSPVDKIDLNICNNNHLTMLVRTNPNIIMVLTQFGGHVCWFTGLQNPKRVK